MGRAVPHLLALLLGVLCALAIGCGDRSNLIPDEAANDLKDQLVAVRQAVDRGECAAAVAAVDRVSARYRDLPETVDRQLRTRIGDGIRALRETVPTDCQAAQQNQTETTPQETTTSETTPPETTTTETTTTETTTTQTIPPETTTTETIPPETTTQTTPSETTPNGGTTVESVP